jgi:hypothetical protein
MLALLLHFNQIEKNWNGMYTSRCQKVKNVPLIVNEKSMTNNDRRATTTGNRLPEFIQVA